MIIITTLFIINIGTITTIIIVIIYVTLIMFVGKCTKLDHVQPYHLLIYVRLNHLWDTGGLFSDFSFFFLGRLSNDVVQQVRSTSIITIITNIIITTIIIIITIIIITIIIIIVIMI